MVLKKVKDEGRDGIFVEQFTALQEGDFRIELQHPAAAEQILVHEVRVTTTTRYYDLIFLVDEPSSSVVAQLLDSATVQ